MASDKLARIKWRMGQSLLPEHLILQEESLLSEMRIRWELSGLPQYGIGLLEWNEASIKEGIFSIVALTFILPSGQLIEIPSNASAKSFNMNITGSSQISLYLHLLDDESSNEETAYQVEDESLEKIFYTVEITASQNHSSSRYTVKLAEFKKDVEGIWKLSDSHIPPLLQIGTSPFFRDTLNYMTQILEAFHFKLSQEITATYLSGENLFVAKQCLQAVYHLQHLFSNLKHQVHCHPYYFYEKLKFFYISLCLYQNHTPENVEVPYLHDQLSWCFSQIIDPLIRQMQTMKAQAPYLPFKKGDGMFIVSKMPKEVVDAKNVYLLLQKPRVTTSIPLEGFKIASMSRIAMVHQLSLQGIPFKKLPNPPFQHTFGPEVDFFLILPGVEWDHALSERSIAFFDQPALEGVNSYIYWRQS